jgi:hypothetical protein
MTIEEFLSRIASEPTTQMTMSTADWDELRNDAFGTAGDSPRQLDGTYLGVLFGVRIYVEEAEPSQW